MGLGRYNFLACSNNSLKKHIQDEVFSYFNFFIPNDQKRKVDGIAPGIPLFSFIFDTAKRKLTSISSFTYS